ncbi:hypothetical protein PHAVU_008G008400 [Phaseolus vulgaris]|uniref:Protein PLASTID MOVEMENT IMPAIRED 2 n=1 Tax=Phaseolus vulgaris TaxID=3885 RepID=V7B0X7_PHAVU|nr:hypothetical protein PHAVU_008G008400g [Phaseolus vulgaris]ESW11180.1 hypothetical protein PHAVU_008G008400g [Phaseolus vulgaris]
MYKETRKRQEAMCPIPIPVTHRFSLPLLVTHVLCFAHLSTEFSTTTFSPNSQAHPQMDGAELGSRSVGSVKATVNFFDDKKPSSRTRELHRARWDIGRYKESKWTAESAKAHAESELSNAKKTVKHLSSMIEESSCNAKTQMRDVERLEKRGKDQHGAMVVAKRSENHECAQVMRELEYLKKELFKLKLDVASVLEEKSRAEKEIEASNSKMLSCLTTAEELRKEIEEANEEQVLAELARIEALKELADIEARREHEADDFSMKLESARKKLKDAIEEIDESKELEVKLAITISDVDLLQNELKSAKKMEKRVQGDESEKQLEEREDSIVLETITEELEAARKELALVKEEGFQFMASMDVIRNELKHVTAETDRLRKKEGKVDSTVEILNSKILRAKSKLEAVSAAEEKARSIVTTLSHSLEKLKTETEEAKKENEHISQEVTATKEEIQKVEFEIDMTEEKLQGVMQELEVAKASESLALEKLKTLSEITMRERALAAQHSSLITISKFEYEYLKNHAASAEEIADKKVAAAEAWIEALKASEKEIVMETKIAQRELKETKLEQELKVYTKEILLSRRVSSEEFENWPRKREKSSSKNFPRAMSRKSIKLNGTITPARGAKFQKNASPAVRLISPFTMRKRKKVIPNLTKLFRGKRNTRDTQ